MTTTPKNKENSPLIYQAKDGSIELRLDKNNETILANLNQIAAIFGVGKATISKHLKNIFSQGELEENIVVSILETTTLHGAIKGKRKRKNDWLGFDDVER